MSNETPITVIGNLTADPELRFTPSGAAVTNFTVASTPRKFNKQTNEFEDGETLFMRCSVWREQAEHVAESLARGMRVVVTGGLVQRNWEDKETGAKRSVMEMQVDEVGPSLRYATAKVTKTQSGGARQAPQDDGWGGQQAQQYRQQAAQPPAQQQSRPAAQQPAAAQQGWGGGGSGAYDEPPF
ncbi:single-stranded DNA-binding protein [Janibacter sp. LM]|uniref:single-stranded DNA-binding protein n=1 Tax=Janibacter sp. LM TaxID=3144845 RepID=UPI0031F6FC26